MNVRNWELVLKVWKNDVKEREKSKLFMNIIEIQTVYEYYRNCRECLKLKRYSTRADFKVATPAKY
jgi:hypothetical protein